MRQKSRPIPLRPMFESRQECVIDNMSKQKRTCFLHWWKKKRGQTCGLLWLDGRQDCRLSAPFEHSHFGTAPWIGAVASLARLRCSRHCFQNANRRT